MQAGYICGCAHNQQPDKIAAKKALLKENGCTEVFVDGQSGTGCFTAFEAACATLRQGDALVVPQMADLCSKTYGILRKMNRLASEQLHFVALSDRIDTRQPSGADLYAAFAAFAALEAATTDSVTPDGNEPRGRGRPKAMSEEMIQAARRLLFEENLPVREVARRLKVSRATIYRHLPLIRGDR